MLAACGGARPPVGAPGAMPQSQAIGGATVRFEPIGPTHMGGTQNPSSGKVNAFAVDPTNTKIIYMASGAGTGLESYSSAGIFRTNDGGASWKAIDNGLTDPSGAISSAVNALWLDPHHPSVLLSATEYDGIFRSSDGGSSWTNVYRTTQATQFATFGNGLFASTAAGILTSTDDGNHWTVQLAGTEAMHPTALGATQGSSGNAFYAGMSDGSIYSFDGSAWSKAGAIRFIKRRQMEGSTAAIHQIAVDPFAPSTVYASMNDGVWDQNLHASLDRGRTWTLVLKKYWAQAIAFSVVHPHRLYIGADGPGIHYILGSGTRNPHMYAGPGLHVFDLRDVWPTANGSDDACWIAADQGLDYEPTCSGSSLNDIVVSGGVASGLARRLAVSPNGETILTSVQDFGGFLTTDGGTDWSGADLEEDAFVELRPGDPSICYAYNEIAGLAESTNGCASFTGTQAGVSPSRLMTTPIAFAPGHPLTMYLLSGSIFLPPGYTNSPIGAYKSTDGGQTASVLPWPFTRPGAIAIDQRDGRHILIGDMSSSGRSSISVTSDGGKSWAKSSGVPATLFWYALAISPVSGTTVLASSVDKMNNVFVLRSADGGRTFKRVATVVNAPLVRGRIDADRYVSGEGASQPLDFLYSPERELRFNEDVKKGVSDVAITTLRGAFISTDNGSKWQRLDDALVAHSFWGIRWLNGYLYLASDGQGIVRSTTPIQAANR
jgi:hypothetical protein